MLHVKGAVVLWPTKLNKDLRERQVMGMPGSLGSSGVESPANQVQLRPEG